MNLRSFFGKSFFIIGERLALIPIILVFSFLLGFDSVGEVKAQESYFRQNLGKDGLFVILGTLDGVEFSKKGETVQETVRDEVPFYDNNNVITVKVESVKVPVTPTPAPIVISSDDIWEQLAQCESGGNWSINTGNGYYGGFQFSQGAWNSVGGSGLPSEASKEEQIEKGRLLQSIRGWGVWGLCAKKLNLN